ncbi:MULTISPECIES: DUF1674 domain-containing protein [unclassified Rhizobium]|uniref:DUF1674 domain-containing protein n=1 Tax=unclassified Rhizobium TaxID=2613769 RepID=UPI0006FEC68F|nr:MULTISPECIES: DUF1674 domain-containing protein [unclassified Rhizobium]KQV35812.1 hypothetical protein ASC86_11520 [Rhizobium sp. Root1212]KRD25919.1 hypothetical protein ASE37_11515 [Rhizobium sp. Root268]
MSADNDNQPQAVPKALSPAAQRALQEAEERRKEEKTEALPAELGGRGGADPARFGDWEINGRAIDF